MTWGQWLDSSYETARCQSSAIVLVLYVNFLSHMKGGGKNGIKQMTSANFTSCITATFLKYSKHIADTKTLFDEWERDTKDKHQSVAPTCKTF